jgi:hypothetical protein
MDIRFSPTFPVKPNPELQKFISSLKDEWQEVEYKLTSTAEWQFLEQPISELFATPITAELAIKEIMLNALAITAGMDSKAKTEALQQGQFSDLILTTGRFVTLKLERKNNNINIKVIITDMGPSYFNIQEYLNNMQKHLQENSDSRISTMTKQHGRGLMIVQEIANGLKSYPAGKTGTVVEYEMPSARPVLEETPAHAAPKK